MVDKSLIQSRRILGIDPGVNITGYGVLDQRANKLMIVEAGVIRGGKAELPGKIKSSLILLILIRWRLKKFTRITLIR